MYINENVRVLRQGCYIADFLLTQAFVLKLNKLAEIGNFHLKIGQKVCFSLIPNSDENSQFEWIFNFHNKDIKWENISPDVLIAENEKEFWEIIELKDKVLSTLWGSENLSLVNKCKLFYYNYSFGSVGIKIDFMERIKKKFELGPDFLTELIIAQTNEEFLDIIEPYYYDEDELYYVQHNNLTTLVPFITLKSYYYLNFIQKNLPEFYKYKPEKARLDLVWFGYRWDEDTKAIRLQVLNEILDELYKQQEEGHN